MLSLSFALRNAAKGVLLLVCVGVPIAHGLESKSPSSSGRLLVVVGAPGEEQYAAEFKKWAENWQSVAAQQFLQQTTIGMDSSNAKPDKELLKAAIDESSRSGADSLWIVLIGHGTFDRGVTKFNLRGSDVSSKEMSEWLKPIRARLVFIGCASSTGTFLTELSGANRVIVTATRSGNEQNLSRFGGYFAKAITETASDLDHDDEVSLLEAFLAASSLTENFYKDSSRLATEHALLDDNGDKLGTGKGFYRGLRPAKAPEPGKLVDGSLASKIMLRSSMTGPKFSSEQLAAREKIELKIEELRSKKSTLDETLYYQQLEALVLQLAAIYDAAESQAVSPQKKL